MCPVKDQQPKGVSWDDGAWWPDSPMSGSVGYVSSEKPDAPPVLLVPDGHGGYREYTVSSRKRGRLGF